MSLATPIASALHVLTAVTWVGGMFFAFVVLAPNASKTLDIQQRVLLWHGVLQKFFLGVWVAFITLFLTGIWLIGVYGSAIRTHMTIMALLGLAMVGIFMKTYFKPFKALSAAVALNNYDEADKALSKIKALVGINLVLGLATIVVAAGGRFL